MGNVFELKQQLFNECTKLDKLLKKGKEFLKSIPDLELELLKLHKKVNDSHVISAGTNTKKIMEVFLDNDFEDETLDLLKQKFTELKMKNINSYSPFNVLTIYKRFFREYKRINNKDLAWQILRNSEKVEILFNEIRKQNNYKDNGVEDLLTESDEIYNELIDFQPNFVSVMPYIDTIFAILDDKVKKQDILNFLSLDKNQKTLININKYSDYITLKEFRNMIFVDSIESENEAYIHRSMAKEFMDTLDNNKELREKVYRDTGINRLPTYSIYKTLRGTHTLD